MTSTGSFLSRRNLVSPTAPQTLEKGHIPEEQREKKPDRRPVGIFKHTGVKREYCSKDEEERQPDKKRTMQRRVCRACETDRAVNQYPNKRRVSSHAHGNDICRVCFREHIEAKINDMTDGQIECPQCTEKLAPKEVEAILNQDSLEKYEINSIRCAMGEGEKLIHCPSGSCDSRQMHYGGDVPIFSCHTCKLRFCLDCECPWHEDEGCTARKERLALAKEQREAADQKLRDESKKREDEEVASAISLQRDSKNCPGCKIKVAKVSGCDHMTCHQCKHQFCWLCLANWNSIIRRDNSAHDTACRYHVAYPAVVAPTRPGIAPVPPASGRNAQHMFAAAQAAYQAG